MKKIFTLYTIFFLISCTTRLDEALGMAGENRRELEVVLQHFKDDPDELKYKAAKFLIENMAYHYSDEGTYMEQYENAYIKAAQSPMKQRDSVFSHYADSMDYTNNTISIDLQTINSKQLIRIIDDACNLWHSVNWSKEYSDDLFFNYVLPYRINHEPLSDWHKVLDEEFAYIKDSMIWSDRGCCFEAEDAEYKGYTIVKRDNASGGKALQMLQNESSEIVFHIDSIRKGRKHLMMTYSATEVNTEIEIGINGRFTENVLLPPTFSTYTFSNNKVRKEILLKEGHNEISIKARSGRFILDNIMIGETDVYHTDSRKDFSGGLYRIKNCLTGEYITFDTLSTALLSEVRLSPAKNNDSLSMLRIECSGYACWRITSFKKENTKLCLEVLKYLPFRNTPITQWKYIGGNNQKWFLLPIGKKRYRIMCKDSGLCLNAIKDDSCKYWSMVQSPYIGSPSQQWEIEQVGEENTTLELKTNSPLAEAYKVYDLMPTFEWFAFKGEHSPSAAILCKLRTGNCRDESNFIVYLSRYLGIPSTVDYTPQWGNRSQSHEWSVIINPDGRATTFYMGSAPGDTSNIFHGYKKPKVFRRMFEVNKQMFEDLRYENQLPLTLSTFTISDVTDEYCTTSDIERRLPGHYNKSDIAYICVFDNKEWVPVYYGKVKRGKVIFKNMGCNIMYMTAVYVDGKLTPVGAPYMVDKKGSVKEIIADRNMKQSIILYRKYPFFGKEDLLNWRMWNGRFQGSNNAEFTDATDLSVFEGITNGGWYEQPVNEVKKFRYLRYIGPNGSFCNINELIFYDNSHSEVGGCIIGSQGDVGKEKEKVFDGDILTGFHALSPDGNWVGLKTKKPVRISKIRFMPRTDGNIIEKGDLYELEYWIDGKWQSVGKKTATCDCITFNNVPRKALYILHDRTKGSEERIFTYENGKQIWW